LGTDQNHLKGISLSANWMWACKNEGEDARLYEAVKACSILPSRWASTSQPEKIRFR
jgi:phosphoribosylformylglycinamidine (FGAM) synthase-like enzyme